MEIILLLLLITAIGLGVWGAIKGSQVILGVGLVVLGLVVAMTMYVHK